MKIKLKEGFGNINTNVKKTRSNSIKKTGHIELSHIYIHIKIVFLYTFFELKIVSWDGITKTKSHYNSVHFFNLFS